ncbi:MAG: O-antigen ligase family protein [Elusimicrobiota bacterium]
MFYSFFGIFVFFLFLSLLVHQQFNTQIQSFSKYLLFVIYAAYLHILKSENSLRKINFQQIEKTIMSLSLIEIAICFFKYFYNGNFSGWLLGNPLYSSLLISAGICFTLFKKRNTLKDNILKGLIICFGFFSLYLLHTRTIFIAISLVLILYVWKVFNRFRLYLLLPFLFFLFLPQFWFFIFKTNDLNSLSSLELIGRGIIWKTALLSIKDHILLGNGIGLFERAYYFYQQPTFHLLRYSHATAFAHNSFLQLAVEVGIPALIFLICGMYFLFKYLRIFKKFNAVSTLTFVFGMAATFYFPYYLPFLGLLFVAVLMSPKLPLTKEIIFPAWTKIVIISFLFLLSSIVFLNGIGYLFYFLGNGKIALQIAPMNPELRYKIFEDSLLKNEFSNKKEVLTALRETIKYDSNNAFYLARIAMFEESPSEQDKYFLKAIKLAPRHAPFYIKYALLQMNRGEDQIANQLLNEALKLEPNAPITYYAKGILGLRKGNRLVASTFFEQSLTLHEKYFPEIDSSPYSKFMFGINIDEIRGLLKK